MQVLRVTTLLVLGHFLTVTEAFGNSLMQEVYGNSYFPDMRTQGRLKDTGLGRQKGDIRLSKTLRDLADLITKRSSNGQARGSPNDFISQGPSTGLLGLSKRQEDTSSQLSTSPTTEDKKSVHIGTGQTVNILRPYADPSDVGFHVSLSHTTTITGRDGTVIFDTIHESTPAELDGFYSVSTGKFTSPVTGTYLVSLSIANKAEDVMLASVYVNQSHKKLTVVSDGRFGISQGSQTGYVKLNKNDVLSVAITQPSYAKVYGSNISSLSVYLLKKQ